MLELNMYKNDFFEIIKEEKTLAEKQMKLNKLTNEYKPPVPVQIMTYLITYGIRIIMGIYATNLYYKKLTKSIEKVDKLDLSPDMKRSVLFRKCGTLPFIIVAIISLVIYLITTVMISQLSSLFNSIIAFINTLGETNFDFNLVGLETSLTDTFKTILTNLGTYVSDGAINVIDSSLGVISTIFIVFAAFIYFLIDMDKIREEIRFFFSKKSEKTFRI